MFGRKKTVTCADSARMGEGLVVLRSRRGEHPPHPVTPGPAQPPLARPRTVAASPVNLPRRTLRREAAR